MVANRLALFGVFAGGCLSGAALLASWRIGVETGARDVSHKVRASEALAALPIATAHAAELPPTPTPVEQREEDSKPRAPTVAESSAPNPDAPTDTATEAGSSLAELLNGFETKYRQGAALTATADAPSQVPAPVAPKRKEARPVEVDAPPAVEAAVRQAPSPDVEARTNLAVRVAAAVPTSVPSEDARPAAAPRPQVEVIVPAREAAEARNISVSIGDIHQNVYADGQDPAAVARQMALAQQAAAAQQVAMYQQAAMYQQQLVMLQYLQLLSLSRGAPISTPTPSRHQVVSNQRISAFPTSLTNTDNPWGFNFPPTVLVR